MSRSKLTVMIAALMLETRTRFTVQWTSSDEVAQRYDLHADMANYLRSELETVQKRNLNDRQVLVFDRVIEALRVAPIPSGSYGKDEWLRFYLAVDGRVSNAALEFYKWFKSFQASAGEIGCISIGHGN